MKHAGPIFIAGKSGQLGRCLVEFADQSNIHAVAAGRPEFDIENIASVDRILDIVAPVAVINAAAYTAVDRAETEPDRCRGVNCDGAKRLANAARRRGVPLVHISTDYVFNGITSRPYRECDRPAPLNVYGRSKLEGEQAVLEEHPGAIVVRTSWVYSSFGTNFLKSILRQAEKQTPLRVIDDQWGCPTSAHDLAAALLDIICRRLIEPSKNESGLYHLSGAGETTWYGFAAAILAKLKESGVRVPILEPITTRDYKTAALRPASSVLDCSKAKEVFGIALPNWSKSLATCIDRITEHREIQLC